jgi:hypothetical protein
MALFCPDPLKRASGARAGFVLVLVSKQCGSGSGHRLHHWSSLSLDGAVPEPGEPGRRADHTYLGTTCTTSCFLRVSHDVPAILYARMKERIRLEATRGEQAGKRWCCAGKTDGESVPMMHQMWGVIQGRTVHVDKGQEGLLSAWWCALSSR